MIKDVRLVEIEIHSYCNRTCWFCPNSFIDRSHKIEMKEWVYLKILQELKDMEYKGVISFSRYNEPLSYMDLFVKRLKQAKEYLPNVKLVTNTNGDFWNEKNRERLVGLIDEITVMDYDTTKKSIVDYEFKNMRVLEIGGFDDFNNRAGLLDIEGGLRTSPCYEPTYFIGIDYNGSVMPCCNYRSDAHESMILGSVEKNTLSNIYTQGKNIRETCIKNPSIIKGCRTCTKGPGRYTRDNAGIEYK